MATSVKKSGTEYEVTINGKTIMLPDMDARQEDDAMIIGPNKKHLEIDTYANTIVLVENEKRTDIVPDEGDDQERMNLVSDFTNKWDQRHDQDAGRRSRLNRKTRRSKRNRRHTKHRKLRKLATRRR